MSDTFDDHFFKKAIKQYPTPFYIYDEVGIRHAAQKLNSAFRWNKGFKNYFAVKALPNLEILKILTSEGMGLDCSSLTELMSAEKIGLSGSDIMFTANNTPSEDLVKAMELKATINLDDLTHIDFLKDLTGMPDLLCFRYNPGNKVKGNEIIGHPEEAKYGMTKQQILDGVKLAQQYGVRRFGLHNMVISNNLDINTGLEVVRSIFELGQDIFTTTGVQLEFINLGGGIGIPYKPTENEFDISSFSNEVQHLYESILSYQPTINMECGRYITGPYGYLVSKVTHIKNTYKTFVGLDASMHNLMRPAMYGAYHHIKVLDKTADSGLQTYDITGSLCENNDKFAIDRQLPAIEIGDTIIIHDTGAHGHAMGFNYNGKLRSAELLVQPDKSIRLIRRAETPNDYFATQI